MKITDQEYDTIMVVRDLINVHNESIESRLMQMITDVVNRFAYCIGKEYFSE